MSSSLYLNVELLEAFPTAILRYLPAAYRGSYTEVLTLAFLDTCGRH